MRLNVEISTPRQYWSDDKLRRLIKSAIIKAVGTTLDEQQVELNSLRFTVPTAKKPAKKKSE